MLTDYLPKDHTYRWAFAFAIAFHVTLAIFLFIKFHSSRQFVLDSSVNIIKAVAITGNHSPAQPLTVKEPFKPMPETKPAIEKKPITEAVKKEVVPETVKAQKTAEILQKRLLQEQAAEAQALKKQIAQQTKQAAMQKALQQAIAKEKTELSQQSRLSPQAQGEIDKYKALVLQAIANEWIVPQDVADDSSCKLLVNIGPKGVVLNVQLIESSGNSLLDRSAKTAVLKASPLPVPDGALFNNFRTIRLTVRPQGVSAG